jgi:hypothetical protein
MLKRLTARRAMCALLTPAWLFGGCSSPEQGPHCRAFIACVADYDEMRGTRTNVDRFLPGGSCWEGEKGAEVCENACRRGIPVLRQQQPELACTVVP